MKANKQIDKKYIHALMAAVTVGVMYVILLYVEKIVPFGDETRLMFDMKRQYADFYAYYKTLITGKNNIFYSCELSLGAGAVGFFTYYLTSPFLLIFLLFDISRIPLAISFTVGLKLVLTAYCCDLFLQYYLDKEDGDNHKNMTTIFAVCYAFCSYIISNSLNPMWLDVFMMMPIVIWMLDRLLMGKKRIGYIISLAYMIYCNYYIAFMVCIFVMMWTLYRVFGCTGEDRKKMASRIVRVVYCSLLAVAIDSWCLIPTVLELFNSPKDITKLGMETTKGNLGLIEIFSKAFVLSFDYNQTMYGTPLIYAGVLIMMLTILYFLNRKISIREKICMAAMFVVFDISFCVDIINLCWHAGMEPSGYPYREAFMYVFLCIICSCRCVNYFMEGISVKRICFSGIITMAFLLIVVWKNFYFVNMRFILINGALIVAYTFVLLMFTSYKLREQFISLGIVLLTLATVAELTLNAVYVYAVQGIMDTEKRGEFAQLTVDMKNAMETVNRDKSFYRVENITPREQNDGMMYDYHPITHYSSAGTLNTRYILTDMGFNDDELYTNYGHNNTCLADMLLGVKYILSTGEAHHREYPLMSEGKINVYGNPYALPVAILVKNFDGDIVGSPFDEQEKQLESIIGRECEIFVPAEVKLDKQIEEDMEVGDFEVTAVKDGNIYFYIDNIEEYTQNMEIFLNGDSMGTYGNAGCLSVINLGNYKKGETINFTIKAYGSTIHEGKAFFVTEDMVELAKCYEEAKVLGVKLEEKSSSDWILTLPDDYEQTDAKGVMLTVPYDDNWTIYSNNTKYEPSMCEDYYLYIPIEQISDGKVELKYVPAGWKAGVFTSIAAMLVIVVLVFADRKKKPI